MKSPLDELKRSVCQAVDEMAQQLLAVSHAIHANPELAFEEREACRLLVSTLEKAGLAVQPGAYGLETAFATSFGGTGSEDGCVALVAEYDALPGIGHACGHNLIATASLGAGLALNSLGARLPGRVRMLGTPAEERGGGKELMARQGAFEGVDAAMMIHPAGFNLVDMPSIAVGDVEVVYRGTAAHASAMPERGLNALDALVIAYQAIAALRQHIRPSERIHGIITDGGQAPNIVPERAAGRFYVRARNERDLAPLKERVGGLLPRGRRGDGHAGGARMGPRRLSRRSASTSRWPPAYQANAERLGREFFPSTPCRRASRAAPTWAT